MWWRGGAAGAAAGAAEGAAEGTAVHAPILGFDL